MVLVSRLPDPTVVCLRGWRVLRLPAASRFWHPGTGPRTGSVLATLSPAQTTPAAIESRVEAIVSKMTLEEKIDLLGGVDGFFTRGVPRLNVPRFKMADGPFGVRNFGPDTTIAGGIALAATWNPALAQEVGAELGRDARAKGVHFLWRLVSTFIAHLGMAETLSILAKTRFWPRGSLLDSSAASKARE